MPCDDCDPDCDDSTRDDGGGEDYTNDPVRYSNGAVLLREADLSIPNGGMFNVRRVYGNQLYGVPSGTAYDGPVGFNWWLSQLPSASGVDSSTVAITFDSNRIYWFDRSGSGFVPRYSFLHVSLTENTSTQTFTFVDTSGGRVETTVFHSLAAATNPGGFISSTNAAGVVTTIAAQTGSQIDELQRVYTVGSTTTTDSLLYSYFTSGSAAGQLQSVTYRRKVGSGSWTSVKQVTYAYYDGSDSQGSANDLQSASQQLPNGTGGWNTVAVSYYRYYLAGDADGFAHGLKLHFGPEAYRLIFNAGINITTASDATLLPYADHYFEYDPSTWSVTKEISAVCDTCVGGGTSTDLLAYTPNPRSPAGGYNTWSVKTVQTLPDSSQIIAYTNYAGRIMLKIIIDSTGTQQWLTFNRYGSDGQKIWTASPSTVTGYDDSYDDLLNFTGGGGVGGGGTSPYLNDTGLISITDYDPSSANVADKSLQQGQSGTPFIVRAYTYTSNTDSNGVTVYPLATETAYPIAYDTSTAIVTSYSYLFYSGTNQIQQKTTTLPAVSAIQNGDGTSPTFIEQYDSYGNLTQRTDERGIVTKYVYDVPRGLVTEQTLNYQSGVTQPGVNVVTDYTYDDQGRLVQTLGPSHSVVLSGSATTVRGATWKVYVQSPIPASGTWDGDQTWTGVGYGTGAGPTYTLINPVSIAKADKNGRPTDQITSKRTSGSGALAPTDTFAQTDWQSWASTQYNLQHQTISSRVYFSIPASGTGTAGTNYGETDYGYDALERQNRIQAPGGTITRTVWTAPQRIDSVWVGTDDTGATDSNPAGSGAPNNMVMVTQNQYDGGGIGDGTLTQVTQFVSVASGDTRVTSYGYDFRDRRTSMTDATGRYTVYGLDNLGRLILTQGYASNGGNLINQSGTHYDDRGRVYQQLMYAVDPASGIAGNALVGNNWYDYSGNLIQSIGVGAGQVFTKQSYNGVGWVTASYSGYNPSGTSYSQATTVAGDVILSQSIPTYDEAGNVISTASYDRLNDAPATGSGSAGALSAGTNPKARISYAAVWFDGIDRPIASANYGAVTSFTRPSTPPASSATVLVSQTIYDDAGRIHQTIDPMGLTTQNGFDAAGRVGTVLERVGSHIYTGTYYTYTLDNQVATLTAVNGSTGNQVTTYTYGTTLSESDVARNDLLRYVDYPDSTGGSDRVSYAYNRLGQQRTMTDQRGNIRTFYYDLLGRPTNDCVTTLGSGTDGRVLQLARAYEVRGMVQTLTSYDSAAQNSGTVLNQVQLDYNHFGQLATEWQDHATSVSAGTPNVQYGYANGATAPNTLRPLAMTYPDGRLITYEYGIAGSMNDRLSRIGTIASEGAEIAQYTYLGAGTVIRIDYPEPAIRLDLWGGTSGTFAGLDQFNRIIDQRWQNNTTATPADIDRYQYGYDQNSNRTWKANPLGTAAVTAGLDKYYVYDPLNRLTKMQRGVLNSTHTGISGTPAAEQDWTLDPVGNWNNFLTKASGTTNLNQNRTQNPVNEITAISNSIGSAWATPAYDAAGNTTTFPYSGDPTQGYSATYDAWNRLIRVSSGVTLMTYRYDARNRRIGSISFVPEIRDYYYTSNWQCIEERDSAAPGVADLQYVWGLRYIDELLCRDDMSSGSDQRLYACQDANFNVTAIADASGNVAQRFVYDPYGNSQVYAPNWTVTTDSYNWMIRFQGGPLNTITGLYYFRSRDLNIVLGRWMQRDLQGYFDGMNLYQCDRSNPVNNLDPYGWNIWDRLKSWPIFGTIYNGTVTPVGTSPGEYDGWGGSYDNFKNSCKCLGVEAAEKKCEDAINAQALHNVSTVLGTPVTGDYVGDVLGLIAAWVAKEGGVISGSTATGIGAVFAADGAVNAVFTFNNAMAIRNAAKQQAKIQCHCPSLGAP